MKIDCIFVRVGKYTMLNNHGQHPLERNSKMIVEIAICVGCQRQIEIKAETTEEIKALQNSYGTPKKCPECYANEFKDWSWC